MNFKNLIKAAAFALIIPIAFGSCKKDFVCTCKSTGPLGESTETYPLENQSRPDAVENCENFESQGTFTTRNCNL